MKTDISDYPVMKRRCKTCPFNKNKEDCYNDPKLVDRIKRDGLTDASQICHRPALSGQRETHLCRGARDFQQEIFYYIGFLEEPTDKAWENKLKTRNMS